MGNALKLGRIFGIPLRLHYTWFLIFFLVVVSLVFSLAADYPLWQRIVGGIVGSFLFFASLIAHELAHSVVAIRYGIPVRSITLFIFGGVAHITKEAAQASAELKMALVGPLSSLLIAGLFAGVQWLLAGVAPPPALELLGWLAIINLFLALFNLLPGFPLDGGRVLRAIIWHFSNNYKRATRVAVLSGRTVAYLFIVGGIALMFITREWFSGLWLAFVGWFLENAATTSYRQSQMREAFQGFSAQDVMTRDCPVISRHLPVGQLVQEHVFPSGRRCFLVVDEGKLEGIVTLHNIKSIPQQQWDTASVGEIMTPADKVITVSPQQDVLSILERMDAGKVDQMPVVHGGRVIGIVARDNLIHFIRTRSELGV